MQEMTTVVQICMLIDHFIDRTHYIRKSSDSFESFVSVKFQLIKKKNLIRYNIALNTCFLNCEFGRQVCAFLFN